ncbi:DNA restriction methylase [Pseudomonas veronii]|uniref:DUF4942 domain-containing protein n=1 Tax=Pseudomonas veronii TaxID=76761 RepID=UPI0017578B1F|nr:DUF4942 domain-containing protein [Pseudomonas veronii]CAD0266055.1 DNA restriction methylase [Pseudomonas veronii]
MTDLSHAKIGDIVEDASVFFAPVSVDLVDGLIGGYRAERARIEQLHELITGGGFSGALQYFMDGNSCDQSRHYTTDLARLMQLAPAIASLNASYWGKALALTDVYEYMPQKRRSEWQSQIRNPMGQKAEKRWSGQEVQEEWVIHPLPEFEEMTVRSTLNELLLSRSKFFAERVDGIFRILSGDHVTNAPGAFGNKLIVANMINSYDCIDHERAGYLNDLRCVIAKFMGREEPQHGDTQPLLNALRRRTGEWGEWYDVDGGTLRMKLFKKGTCHIQVHPEMAWRLNAVLASLYPAAIPASFRTKPKAKGKQHTVFGKPLPFAVVAMLSEMQSEPTVPTQYDRWSEPRQPVTANPHALTFQRGGRNSAAQAEAEKVLAMIGGVRHNVNAHVWFEFEFCAREALDEIIMSGMVPDVKGHQFYPTPDALAEQVLDLADIQEGHSCLEPEAGVGGLADRMPRNQTRCIEISALHCKVLAAKGFDVTQADFIEWASMTNDRFDRIVMNPPFSEGRWLSHLTAAAGLLNADGQVTAVLPANAKRKDLLPGFDLEWSGIIDNAFVGTSVSVVILVARKHEA